MSVGEYERILLILEEMMKQSNHVELRHRKTYGATHPKIGRRQHFDLGDKSEYDEENLKSTMLLKIPNR